jgi:hypothetical protein
MPTSRLGTPGQSSTRSVLANRLGSSREADPTNVSNGWKADIAVCNVLLGGVDTAMTILKKIRAAILVAEARRLSSVHQTGRAFEKMMAAYSHLGEQPPSAKLPLEVNLSLAAMAANANRHGLVYDALVLVEQQLPTDRSLNVQDRRYVGAYVKALRLLCDGNSWAEALSDADVVAGSDPTGVKRHWRANFPFV